MLKSVLLTLALIFPALSQAQEAKPNHLLGQSSPYLQQHLYNPVDWYPWGAEALEKAKREGKPIFLSIGYSTCHWCHVMEEESFTNPEIAAYLNENFVSIKVDREERPDLDEQYMLVTQALTGSGGWPNSVFLTSGGDPFYAGTYFPPDDFLDVLQKVNGEWKANSTALSADAAGLSAYIRDYMNRSAAARDVTPEAIRTAAQSVLPDMDEFNGGLGVAPKFPQESLFLFLLDQAERDGDPAMLAAVTNILDGMVKGGVYDHVGGGFHRYATDPEWRIPHFEKMLYNQAMIGRLLTRGWETTQEPAYRWAAERTFDYVLREMQAPAGGFYAAQDADSLDKGGDLVEGAFYIWTPEEIRAASAQADMLIETFNVVENGPFEGANILYRSDLPEGDFESLNKGLEDLRLTREHRPRPFTDQKIVTGWNGAMIQTLAEAGAVFQRPDYSLAARKAAQFLVANLLDDTGLKRSYINGTAGIDAHLADYAALGMAALALQDYGDTSADWLALAQHMATEIPARFGTADGRYRMAEKTDGIGVYKPLDDSELPAGNALTLELFAALSRRTDNPAYAQQAQLLQAAIAGAALEQPVARAFTLKAAQDFTLGATGTLRYLSGGAVRISAEQDRKNGRMVLNIQLKDGWHINAHKPLDDFFVPTDVAINGQPAPADIYPEPKVKQLGFNPAPLALYEGALQLTVPLETGETALTVQACSDTVCLSPETVVFRVW